MPNGLLGTVTAGGSGYVNPNMPPEVARLLAEMGFAPDGSRVLGSAFDGLSTRQRLDNLDRRISSDWERMGFEPTPRPQTALPPEENIFVGANSPFADTGPDPFGQETRARLDALNQRIDADMAAMEPPVGAPPPDPRNPVGGMSYTPALPPAPAPAPIQPPPRPVPIDPRKPQLHNPDGSISTERTITLERDGRWYNVPTIINGRPYPEETIEQAFGMGQVDHVGEYPTLADAELAARSRSDAIGGRLIPPPPKPTPRPRPTAYIVKKGDNPTTIARMFGMTLRELEAKNPGILKRARNLRIGASVNI